MVENHASRMSGRQTTFNNRTLLSALQVCVSLSNKLVQEAWETQPGECLIVLMFTSIALLPVLLVQHVHS